MKQFMDKDFLLSTDTAKELFHDYAEKAPILDYHCHIDPKEIAQDRKFDNITQVWLGGDHYKWRLMRSNGVEEKYITGDATDREKYTGAGDREPAVPLEPSGASEIFWIPRRPEWRDRGGSVEPVQCEACGGFHERAQYHPPVRSYARVHHR